jgi:hypothetical protein
MAKNITAKMKFVHSKLKMFAAQVMPVIPGQVITHLPLQVCAPSASPGLQTQQFQHYPACQVQVKTLKATNT